MVLRNSLWHLFTVAITVSIAAGPMPHFGRGALAAVVSPCNEPFIPADLDFFRTVHGSSTTEIHVHGEYRIGHDTWVANKDAMERNMTLVFPEDTYFRASVAPNSLFFMELMLHDVDPSTNSPGGSHMVTCSTGQNTRRFERMVSAKLDKNHKYVLVFKYSLGANALAKCPKVLLELAAQGVSAAPKFHDACAGDTDFPRLSPNNGPIQPTEDQKYYFAYRSDGPKWAALDGSLNPVGDQYLADGSGASNDRGALQAFAAPYEIRLPHLPGRHQKWKLRFQIHANFLDGGDIAAVLTSGNQSTAPTLLQCSDGHVSCAYGLRAVKNTFIMQEILWGGLQPGGYATHTLWLVLRRTSQNLGMKCAPYQVTLDLFPLHEDESFVSCAAEPLPRSFHQPGLYNDVTGVLRYTADVLVNMSAPVQMAILTPTHPKSLARFWLGNHYTLDIDLVLYRQVEDAGDAAATNTAAAAGGGGNGGGRRFEAIAASIRSAGPEGIIAELEGGKTYAIEAVISSKTRTIMTDADRDYYEFCDSFELLAHVFPLINTATASACVASAPVLTTLQTQLNASHDAFFGLPSAETLPYTFAIDPKSSMDQVEIFSWDFYVKRTTFLNVLIPADNYGGRPQVQLLMRGNSREVLYGASRAFGNGLHAVIMEGWYTLKVLTPYVQFSIKTWADAVPDMPLCIRYNLWINMAGSDLCVDALPLPEELTFSPTSRHHFIDQFQIPESSGSDQHNLVIAPLEADMVLHVSVTDATVPCTVLLYRRDAASGAKGVPISVASAHLGSTTAEVFELVEKGQSYILEFNFERGNTAIERGKHPRSLSRRTAKQQQQDDASEGESSEVDENTATHQVIARRACETMRLQFSLVPNPPASPSTNEGHRCVDMAGTLSLSEQPIPLPFSTNAVRYYRQNPGTSLQVTFSLDQTAYARGVLNYDFSTTSIHAFICPGSAFDVSNINEAGCMSADPYFNGADLTTTALQPGTYTIALLPWPEVVSSTTVTNFTGTFCQLVQLRLDLVAVSATKAAPALCPAESQHLPHSLNVIGRLSPFYGDQAHMMQHVRINGQNAQDATMIALSKRSQVRLFVPEPVPNVHVRYSLFSKDGPIGMVGSPGHSVLVELPPGNYALGVQFEGYQVNYDESTGKPYESSAPIVAEYCQTIPLSISVVPVDRVQDYGVGDDKCGAGAPAFPKEMFHHGHETMYRRLRNPSDPATQVFHFDQTINFTVGDLGGDVDIGVLYPYQSSPIAASLVGQIISGDGKTATQRLAMSYHRDYAFFNGELRPGQYTFRIHDPVNSGQYQSVTQTVVCAPYVLHLRFNNFGNRAGGSPAPTRSLAPGETKAPSGVRPVVLCPDHMDVWQPLIRRSVVGRSTASNSWFTYHGRSFRIPFEAAETFSGSVAGNRGGNTHGPLMKVVRSAHFAAQAGDYVRIWARTEARAVMSIAVYNGNATVPLQSGAFWGWHSQTLAFRPSTPNPRMMLRVDVTFYLRQAPVLGEDYTDCAGKIAASTFELLVSAFPASRINSLQTCMTVMSDVAADAPPSDAVTTQGPGGDGTNTISNPPPPQIVYANSANTFRGEFAFGPTDFGRSTVVRNSDISEGPMHNNHGGTPRPRPVGRRDGDNAMISFFTSRVDAQHNVSLVVPQGTRNARVAVILRFNLLIANMRLRLVAPNGSAVAHSETHPASDRDEEFNAVTTIDATGLPAGTYVLSVLEANAESDAPTPMQQSNFCITYQLSVFYSASQYPNGMTDAPPGSQRLLSVSPTGLSTMDISDPLVVTLTFDRPIPQAVLPAGSNVVTVDDNGGHSLVPALQYFHSATQFRAVYPPFSFDWYTQYTVRVHLSALNANSQNHVVAPTPSMLETAMSTATCGCDDGFCAVGGICMCREPTGTICSVCAAGSVLSSRKIQVGPVTGMICNSTGEDLVDTSRWVPTPTRAGDTLPPVGPTPPTPPSPGVPTTPTAAGNATKAGPPLKFLRVVLSYSAAALLGIWSIVTIARHRSRLAREAKNFHNPFRRIATNEEEAEDDDHQRPPSHSQLSGGIDNHPINGEDEEGEESHA